MKQKFNYKRKKTNKAKKVLLGVGVGFLALAAAAGTAWALNNHYHWVELPDWLTPPSEEVPAEPDHAVVILAKTQEIETFSIGLKEFQNYKYGDAVIMIDGLKSVEFNQTDYRFVIDVDTVASIELLTDDLSGDCSLPFELENGFIYDFSDFTVVVGEALVPVVTAIA